jgi:hypothetical protein
VPNFFNEGIKSIYLISLIYLEFSGKNDSPYRTDKKSKKDVLGHYRERVKEKIKSLRKGILLNLDVKRWKFNAGVWIHYSLMAEAKANFPKKKANPTIPTPRTNVRDIIAVMNSFMFRSSFQNDFDPTKNPWMKLRHGFKVRSLLWQPGHPRNLQ